MNIEQSTIECEEFIPTTPDTNIVNWNEYCEGLDDGPINTSLIKQEILNEENINIFEPNVKIKEEGSFSETAINDDDFDGRDVDNLIDFPEDYMKTEEDQSESIQDGADNTEEGVSYSTFIKLNGVNIRVENKEERGSMGRPLTSAELSKRYRDRIKTDPQRRAKYKQKIKERNLKSKMRKLGGKIEIKVEEPSPETSTIRDRKTTVRKNLYKCNQCEFETKYKHYIKVHILRHKNPDEGDVVKCAHCDYQTIHKTSFRKHILRHRDPDEVEKYFCEHCSYRTADKAHLKRHSLIHVDAEEAVIYKCDDCDFQTVHKDSLKKHSIRHKDPSEVNLFKCTECDFQTPRKDSIKLHILRHQNPDDVDMLKCDVCDFQTVHKFSLKSHLLLHKNPDEKEWFTCTDCDYKTIYKSSLKKHSICHKNREDVKKIKCDQCDYETPDRGHLKRHSILHMDPEEVSLKCTECNFQTLYKATFKNHMARHLRLNS